MKRVVRHRLHFRFEAGTSRGVFTEKDTYYVLLEKDGITGVGECAPLKGLSIDAVPDFEAHLGRYLELWDGTWNFYELPDIERFPSILMGFETALLDWEQGGGKVVYSRPFVEGSVRIPINGLIWMGKPDFMQQQIREKLESGYSCIKMKIGAIDFEEEYALLKGIRKQFGASDIVLRVDANGAFSPAEAMERLKRLSDLEIHSIEQPIKQGQWEEMAKLCEQTPVPIALDEELIGIHKASEQQRLLDAILPQYIILKPTLHGGFRTCERWIGLAEQSHIGWWMTSALESNIGLNAIAQFTASAHVSEPQGLGTGQLFHNNIDAPLQIERGHLYYSPQASWGKLPEHS